MRTTKDRLAEIPDLMAELFNFLEPGTVPTDPDQQHAKKPYPSKPPLRVEVVDLLDTRRKPDSDWAHGVRDLKLDLMAGGRRLGIVPTLETWVRMTEGEMLDANLEPTPLADYPTASSETGWLTVHLEWILEQPWADEFEDDIQRIHKDLKHACGHRDEYMPTCPDCGNLVTPRDNYSWWACTACPRKWQHDAEVKRMFAQQGPVTLRQAAKMLGVSHTLLYAWRKGGRFMPAGRNSKGELFHIEVIKKARDNVKAEA